MHLQEISKFNLFHFLQIKTLVLKVFMNRKKYARSLFFLEAFFYIFFFFSFLILPHNLTKQIQLLIVLIELRAKPA